MTTPTASPSRRRMLARLAAASIVLLAAGCFTDRTNQAASTRGDCPAAALLVDELVASAGQPSASAELAARARELTGELEATGADAPATEASARLAALLPADPDAAGSVDPDAWHDALDDLDGHVADRCGFSIRVLVADRLPRGTVDPEVRALQAEAVPATSLLDWDAILGRIPDAAWVESGYDGIVGIGPGVYVTVSGVPSREEAVVVCNDVLGALQPESAAADVIVTVQSLGRQTLAASVDGECVETGQLS